ncbi:MAG: choice-of-anchor J domain-containing protein, partial [Muribaculaceae bacterium]|nr:choice-of-anchor J domain-containing protein [Muribaculaceae bacterium]
GDDWVFIDPLEVEAGDYVLRFWYSATENHTERLRVCWGNEARPEAMTNTICEIDPMNNEEYEESISLFSIPSSQKVFVGFYAYSDADENWLLIDDLSIEKADASLLDIQVSAISEPGSYIRSNNRRDVVAGVRNISIADKTVAVSLYVDEVLVETKQEVVRLMEARDITFANALAGLSDGAHSVKVVAAYDGDTDLSNNTAVLDIMVMEKAPVAIWDFEDEEFPAGFTFRSEDSASVNPGGTDLFGDNGLAIMGVQNHYLYGSNVFAICTWFDDASVTADRWLVLPQMHINGENSHLVWDCSSMSAQDYDDYDICVSTGNDVWYEYTTVMSVKGENEFAKTRGVSLAPYSGKDVYVAFHVKTVDGMALILDNIGLYGELSTAGVEGVVSASPEASLRYVGGSIVCGVDAEISVFALDGSLAAQGSGMSLDVAHLAPGVYVARATGAAAGATLKFVVK